MFEEAQLYSPVTLDDDGRVEVHLGKDHPGFNDPAYRERRNADRRDRDGLAFRANRSRTSITPTPSTRSGGWCRTTCTTNT